MRQSLDQMRQSLDAMRLSLVAMRVSLVVMVVFMAFGFAFMTLMLYRQGKILRETHALSAKAAAALDNVSRLVVHAGVRT